MEYYFFFMAKNFEFWPNGIVSRRDFGCDDQ